MHPTQALHPDGDIDDVFPGADAIDDVADPDDTDADDTDADVSADGWDDDDPLAPQARDLARWARQRRRRGVAGLLAVLAAAAVLGFWAWSLTAGG